ncbi:MAG: BatD family protein [Saprospiraceae bacterium]|nr:BatD family protein [Saprospiraceae bacterium]
MKWNVWLSMILWISISSSLQAQSQKNPVFTVEINRDSVLMGNAFKVTFLLENGKGLNFQVPEFKDFEVVGGPNQSSSFSMVNGDVSQKMSYSFFLSPKMEGSFFIEPASIEVGGKVLETLPMEVNVYPNPDGIIQQDDEVIQHNMDFFFRDNDEHPQPKMEEPQKKRKTYKL